MRLLKKGLKRLLKSKNYAQYQLKVMDDTFQKGDFRWEIRNPFRIVTLVNPKECENRIDVWMLVKAWKGTGHVEWEILLAGWLVMAVLSALEKHESEADISMLFDRDFYARTNDLVFRQEEVHKHILPSFEVVSETENELRLRLKVDELEGTP